MPTRDQARNIAVRALLAATTRDRAANQARTVLANYLAMAGSLTPEQGAQPVEVPSMSGVDEDMRRWSFFMLLQHNTIVNRSITAITTQLARGEPLHGAALIDPKRDVMPSATCGVGEVDAFQQSVEDHLAAVAALGDLRDTATAPHPVFGDFNAHLWNAMFSFHLKIHLKQAQSIASQVSHPA